MTFNTDNTNYSFEDEYYLMSKELEEVDIKSTLISIFEDLPRAMWTTTASKELDWSSPIPPEFYNLIIRASTVHTKDPSSNPRIFSYEFRCGMHLPLAFRPGYETFFSGHCKEIWYNLLAAAEYRDIPSKDLWFK